MKMFIQKIVAMEHLTRNEAATAMRFIMEGNATDAHIAAFLVALKMKGESPEEILGFVDVMEEKATRITPEDPQAIDMCGTGGDGMGTFNISTAASFVVAGAGVTVAKHGNRAISSSCGSADVLKALGIDIDIPFDRVQRCVNDVGIAFLFAPLFHPAMKFAARVRSELSMKTCFNILGPLANPAGVKRQLVGAFNQSAASTMAKVFSLLQFERVCVVHSEDGLDEVSLGAPTTVIDVTKSAPLRQYVISPVSFGLPHAQFSLILGGSSEHNASIVMDVLRGIPGPHRDCVVANAAMGLFVAGRVESLKEGVLLSSESIDSGKALAKLLQLRKFAST